jgi:ribosome biogenesis GTPase A
MNIQWFPGHMHKARVQMAEILPKVDLVIEVLDARIPYSSENPMLAELRGDKPCLKVMNKSDLADPELTSIWRTHFEQQRGVRARSVTTQEPKLIRQLAGVCQNMFPTKQDIGKHVTAMICGIPNVGKSTLINILAGRKVAKTGNEPAVTKGQQRIKLNNGVVLLDTPGVLWPNVSNEKSGYRLATIGSIKDTAMEYEDVAYFAAGYLLETCRDRVIERYSLDPVPNGALELLDAIGNKRGCLNKRGIIDYDRVSRILLTELRSGMLGPITLETPDMMELEKSEVADQLKEKEETKAKRKTERKARFKDKQQDKRRRRG